MKEYKSSKELLLILESKGIIINDIDYAEKCLSDYSYYSVINSYKLLFMKDKKFIKNVKFEEIFSLFRFDRELKNIFMKYILEIESITKTKISNLFGEKYGIRNYLKEKNFNYKNNVLFVDKLIQSINLEIKKNYMKHEAITHYIEKHKFIPPWVLMKILSLGTVSKLYGLMKQSDKQEISKYFNLSDKHFKSILGTLTTVRNICAHDDRLFSFKSVFFVNINKIYNKEILKIGKINYTNMYIVIMILFILLPNNQRQEFKRNLVKCFNRLEKNLKSVSISEVKKVMGFPNEYVFE